MFRAAWEDLCGRLPPRRADLSYLRILKLAATGLETDVASALTTLLASGTRWTDETVAACVKPESLQTPAMSLPEVDLATYDQLLSQEADDVAA